MHVYNASTYMATMHLPVLTRIVRFLIREAGGQSAQARQCVRMAATRPHVPDAIAARLSDILTDFNPFRTHRHQPQRGPDHGRRRLLLMVHSMPVLVLYAQADYADRAHPRLIDKRFDDPPGLAPGVKEAGTGRRRRPSQRLPPPTQGRRAAIGQRIRDAPAVISCGEC
jgi:hypothetical protein